jgi:serine/threonine protein kinase
MADIWVARRAVATSSDEAAPGTSAARVAIKTLLKRRLHHGEYVERFAQEAELHRRLDHPNIVHALETDVEAGVRYLVLEFVEGLNLRQMIHAAKPRALPRAVIYDVMASICDALHYLHELAGEDGPLGVVHCDVSPENVLIGLDGRVKLIDFGLAAATLAAGASGPSSAVLETSVLRPGRHVPPGRLQYLAPERVDGRGLDRRADIYSVGAMLFELVHGVRPFQADTTYEFLTRICQGATVSTDSAVDAEARDLIEHAMAVAPEDRIDSAKHFSDALRLLRELVDPDEQTVGAFVRRLFGLEEPEDAEEIDLLWTEEKVTAEIACLDSPCDTPLLEEGTALDVQVRELLQLTSRATLKSDGHASKHVDRTTDALGSAFPDRKTPPPPSMPLPDVFAPIARAHPSSVDLFDVYGKRTSAPPPASAPAAAPASGTFLASRESASWIPAETGTKPARVAATRFEAGWNLLREGKVNETLAEWEAAMELDPNNRSYAVNVQKLRQKMQR